MIHDYAMDEAPNVTARNGHTICQRAIQTQAVSDE
jgi:hypothetical protein